MVLGNKSLAVGARTRATRKSRLTIAVKKVLARTIEVPRVADLKAEDAKASRARTSKKISEQPIDRYRAEAKALCTEPMLGTIGDLKCRRDTEETAHYAERIATLVERAETRED